MSKKPPQILGADGTPIVDPEDLNVLLIEARKALKDDKTALLVNTMTQAHQLYQFARSELEFQNLTPEVLQLLIQSSVGKSTQGFTLQQLVRSLSKKTVPFLEHELRQFKQEEQKRKDSARKLERSLPPVGFRMPLKSMQDKVERFTLSSVFLILGRNRVGRSGLMKYTAQHFRDKGYRVAYLSGADHEPDERVPWASMLMPASWWSGMAESAPKFYETLEPVVSQDMHFLFVENLSIACGVQDSFESMRDWIQRAVSMFTGWGSSKRVALFLALDVSQAVDQVNLETDFPFITQFPHVVSDFHTVDISGVPTPCVVVENDVIPLEKNHDQ